MLLGACGSSFLAAFMFSLKYSSKSAAESEGRERVVLGLSIGTTL